MPWYTKQQGNQTIDSLPLSNLTYLWAIDLWIRLILLLFMATFCGV